MFATVCPRGGRMKHGGASAIDDAPQFRTDLWTKSPISIHRSKIAPYSIYFCSSPPARGSKRKLPWRRTEACIGAPRYTSRQAVTLDTSNHCLPVRLLNIRLSLDCGSFKTFFKNFPSLKVFKASNTCYLAKRSSWSFRLFERRI